MKKLIALLAAVIAVGVFSVYMLENHADLQVSLPTTYETAEDAGYDPVPESVSTGKLNVKFPQKKTFYSEDVDVELASDDENAVIYYTTDGNDPTTDSARYSEPIHLTAKNRETCTTVKAIAVDGEQQTDIAVKSYIVGRNVEQRFDESTLVFVLSSDEYNLYDYYNGIAVEGYLRDEFMKNEYKGGEINPTDPANYNIGGRESERPMYVEVFDSKGEQLISQAAGARVVGGYSRAVDQKSWRLIARNLYSEGNGKFKYPFFTGNTDGYGNFLTRYDRITLRNGANDREFAGLRDELTMTLAAEAGFPDTQAVTPAAVFLNGEYYGYAWLHEAYSEDYLEMMYGGTKENFRIVGSRELEVESDNEEDAQAIADWQRIVELAEKDLTFDIYFNEFCQKVDIDNLMMYYAMQIYVDNKDWPGNNFKVWRYYPADGEITDSPYLDGKWRFLLFDAEYAWGLYGAGYSDDTLRAVLTGKHMQGASHILRGLLYRKDIQEKFADTVCELTAGAFSPENVKARLDELIAESDAEQMYALKNGYTSEWANEWTFADSRQQIRDFAEYRPTIMKNSFMRRFGISGERYNVSFRAPTGASIKAGALTAKAGESASIAYFTEYGTELAALPYDGYTVDHWDINGMTYTGDTIRIDSSLADTNGNVTVSLYLNNPGTPGAVRITELYTAGDDDAAVITNSTAESVNLRGWYLSDKATEPDRYELPDTEIPAGGSVTIVFKDNNGTSALMKHRTNFSLKPGETLYLNDRKLNTVSQVPVLALSPGQYISLGADGSYTIHSTK
ncbi:MAG: CotH kinase family protein [Ruminiclostridium sp.]|nr:CotH kinase family protein [Ruminiclostridium sp.]